MKLDWPNTNRYGLKSLALWGMFLGALVGLEYAQGSNWPIPLQVAVALIPAATVIAQFRLVWTTVSGQDEVVRAQLAQRLLIAGAITITVAVAFATLKTTIGLPNLPIWLLYPLFWAVLGISSSLIRAPQ